MDLLDRSGIDFGTLDGPVELRVNGEEGSFSQELRNHDKIIIRQESRRAASDMPEQKIL